MNAPEAPVVNWHDHARCAQAALPDAAWAYFSGSAADGLTAQANEAAWQQLQLAPRVLQALGGGHTHCQVLGREWPCPIGVAPMAHLRWAHADAEVGMALAAAAQGCAMVVSHQTSTPLQAVAQAVSSQPGRGPLWFQMHWQSQRALTAALLRQIEAAGYEALVLTVDAPVNGVRDAERRHGMRLPASVRPVHWPARDAAAHGPGLCAGLANAAPTWADVQWLLTQTPLPVLLKGITHPQDALRAVRMGAAGVVVSNHGGRVLDTLPAAAALLPAVVQAVRSHSAHAPVLVDGGVRRGSDVFKALALGANAVLLGRPAVYGLAHAGARGAAHVLRVLRDELEATMALCGCARVEHIGGQHLHGHRPTP